MKTFSSVSLSIAFMLTAAFSVRAETIIINEIDNLFPVDAWGQSTLTTGGTAGLVNLTSLGGDLNNNQPGGPEPAGDHPGVARLTTIFNNSSRAELGTFQDFGLASSVLSSIDLAYSYYKASNPGQNLFAAPSLKLDIFNPAAVGDGFGTLVYEPNWNQPGGGSQAPPLDSWETVSIDETTGGGDNSSGGWFWTGGFGEPNGFGGPPIRSLAEWNAAFTAAAPADYADARVTGIRVGVGSFNQGQIGYFDEVSFVSGPIDKTYVFTIPEPSRAMLALIGLSMAVLKRKRKD